MAKVELRPSVQFHANLSAEVWDAVKAEAESRFGVSFNLIVEDALRAHYGLSNYQVASGMLRGGGRR